MQVASLWKGTSHVSQCKENENQGAVAQNNEINQKSLPGQGALSTASTIYTSTAANSYDLLLQDIPMKVISNSGSQITTYGLID